MEANILALLGAFLLSFQINYLVWKWQKKNGKIDGGDDNDNFPGAKKLHLAVVKVVANLKRRRK